MPQSAVFYVVFNGYNQPFRTYNRYLRFSVFGRFALIPSDVPDSKVVCIRNDVYFRLAFAEKFIAYFVAVIYHKP